MSGQQTIMTGLLGYPVEHSMSPVMQNAAFKQLGIPYYYAAFAVHPDRLGQAVEGIRALGFRGVNVTIPHKVNVIDFLDDLHEEARLIGAVNTIVHENGKLIGYNTDGRGYVRSLLRETKISLSEQNVLILGAGGAARAIAVSLARSGVAGMVITNRTPEKAAELAESIQRHTDTRVRALSLSDLPDVVPDSTLLINTTSVGMSPNESDSPVPGELLHQRLVVSDLVYNPLETKLLKEARQAGCVTHSGLGMLVHQGALAFELWTGKEAPAELMYEKAHHMLTST
ncbi:MAG: shikimate dehydrogenase [Bacillaceae bacterium]|nr:shikimate dehydrogenase [Bacillaceae bacterium]